MQKKIKQEIKSAAIAYYYKLRKLGFSHQTTILAIIDLILNNILEEPKTAVGEGKKEREP
jgi:hypothetical protein